MRKLRWGLAVLLVLFMEVAFVIVGGEMLKRHTVPFSVSFVSEHEDCFRSQQISDENIQIIQTISKEHSIPTIRLLATAMATHKYSLGQHELEEFDWDTFERMEQYLLKHKKKEYEKLLVAYGKIWQDVEYFPVAESKSNQEAVVSFEDSWMYERNYGGKRGHEGTDIMAGINERGYYPVVSMTDGVIEKIGWLEKGGYRIGIRSPSGGYFYYAHLYRYAEDFHEGDAVQAGELIGYMGDSGYGKEGTVGQFAVHLHLGIYINAKGEGDLSVNPYPVLKYFREKTLKYSF